MHAIAWIAESQLNSKVAMFLIVDRTLSIAEGMAHNTEYYFDTTRCSDPSVAYRMAITRTERLPEGFALTTQPVVATLTRDEVNQWNHLAIDKSDLFHRVVTEGERI